MRGSALLALFVLAGCGGGGAAKQAASTPAPKAATSAPTAEAVATPVPRLTNPGPCPGVKATCSTLTVPLDPSGKTPGTLKLRIATAGRKDGPVLLFLTGGPGQPGVPFITRATQLSPRWRVAVIDQRGTGQGALDCPALQETMGASDLTPPSESDVTSCAKTLGDNRRFYTTTETVADLEALRVALGVDKLAFDGVSYGTYVAERYALAHPDHTDRLILDSVVPHAGVTLYSEVSMQATTRVLGAQTAADLAAVIKREHNGPELLDTITTMSIGKPHLTSVTRVIEAAKRGNPRPLDRLSQNIKRYETSHFPASQLSQGLHASTLCTDTAAPWGDARAPLAGRQAKLDAGAAQLSAAQLGPYDRATATGNGIALSCLYWPPENVPAPAVAADLPNVPTLLLAGDKDLSTPLEWARAEAAHAPGGKLVVVPGDGHSVQSQGGKGLAAAKAFLAQN